MRIALVVERFEPGTGGVENVAWQVAHGLVRAGDAVDVIARRATASAQVRIRTVNAPTSWQPLRVWSFSRAAARAAPRESYDVVYSLARTTEQDVYRAGGGSHADYLQRRFRGSARALRRISPRHALLIRCDRRVFADPSQIVQCGSEMVHAEIVRRYGVPAERLHVLRNGVDLERFRPPAPGARRQRAGGASAPCWLFVGRGFARKGLDTALRALAHTRDARLRVAGGDAPGPWQRLATRLGVAQRVEFLGFQRDLPALYAEADALLLPTRYDAFANVCLEAAAAGLPVVTSAANGAAELLRGAGGWIVDDAEDVDAFADALDALRDPARRRRLGEAGRAVAEANGWEAHVTALRRLFAGVRP